MTETYEILEGVHAYLAYLKDLVKANTLLSLHADDISTENIESIARSNALAFNEIYENTLKLVQNDPQMLADADRSMAALKES